MRFKYNAIIIICILIFSTTTVFVSDITTSNVSAATYGDYTYELIDGGTAVEITDYAGSNDSIIIPGMIASLPVTSIGSGAFSYCSASRSIIIPDGVTSIGDGAFFYCSALRYISIPNSVTFIGGTVFSYCSDLTSINIPDGVTSIGDVAFYQCSALTSIIIPDSVTSIGDGAFSYCSGLTSISIPDGVTSIGNGTFSYCYALTSIIIPDGVTSIGDSAFYDCYALTSIIIPDGVTSIGDSAFYDCYALTSIIIPDGVTSIGDSAFSSCHALTSIIIPDSVTSVGASAFYGCYALTSIKIPDSVTSVGANAFYDCSDLTSINIPDSVTSLGYQVFYGCDDLLFIIFEGDAPTVGNNWVRGCSNNIIVYYYESAIGFTTPTWEGVQTKELSIDSPSQPTNLISAVGDRSVTLTWAEPNDEGNSSIDYYVIYQDGVEIGTTTDTTFTVSDLTNDVKYVFTVAAHNSAGSGAITSVSTVPSISISIPGAPLGLTVTISDESVTLSWTAPSNDGGADIDYYIIYQDGVQIGTTTETTYTVDDLTNNETYVFTVAAHNSAGVGNISSSVSATPSDSITAPGTPMGLNAETDDGSVTLSWTAPSDDGGADIDYYIIYQDGVQIGTTTETTYTVDDLTNNETYVFTVAAHNSAGTGTLSSEEEVTVGEDASTSDDDSGSDSTMMIMIAAVIIAVAVIALIVMFVLRKERNSKRAQQTMQPTAAYNQPAQPQGHQQVQQSTQPHAQPVNQTTPQYQPQYEPAQPTAPQHVQQPQQNISAPQGPKFCPNCGAPSTGSAFCPNCGNKVR